MALALFLTLALALFALTLIIQSQILRTTDDNERQRLVNRVKNVTLRLLVPISVIMVIVGFTSVMFYPSLHDSSISVGFTLMGTSVVMLIRGESLRKTGDEAISFGRRIGIYAWIFFIVAILGFASQIIRIILYFANTPK